jgi:hypothetical protein
MESDLSIFSIPPYISVSWKEVRALSSQPGSTEDSLLLQVLLQDGRLVEIPNLPKKLVHQLFTLHKAFFSPALTTQSLLESLFPPPKEGKNLLNVTFEHTSQEQAPNLPEELLKKFAEVGSLFGVHLPDRPEEGCSCVACQIARSIQPSGPASNEEAVSEYDLKFRDWEVKEVGSQLYVVTHPLHPEEQYTVFLGVPLGCTCGHAKCDHIKATLQT